MSDEPKVSCPLCGNLVPTGATKCPVCATDLQKVKPLRTAKGSRLPASAEDYLRKELPKIELPKARMTCPLCAVELKGGETKCPRCGIPLAIEKEMLECPECGAIAPFDAKSCPKCGVGFGEAPEIPPPPSPRGIPPPPLPIVPPVKEPVPLPETTGPPSTGPAYPEEGLVNGRGAVDVAGLGGTRGAVNGTGLVNGTGVAAAPRAEGETQAVSRRNVLLVRRWQFMAVLVVVVVVLSTFILLSYPPGKAPVSVDGDFGDWASAQKFSMYSMAGAPQINVDEWAVKVQGEKVFAYLKVQSAIMGTTNVNSFYLFIDNDNSADTGYAISGIGADYMAELDGWNGSVRSTSVMEYSSDTDQYDWNSWVKIGSASATASGTQLEASVDLPLSVGSSAKFMLLSKDSFDRNGLSYPVPLKGGLLVIKMEPGAGILANGIVPSSTSVAFLKLTLTCDGAAARVENIVPTVYGGSTLFAFQSIDLSPGQERSEVVAVDTSSLGPGALVSASVVSSGVTSGFADVTIVGESVKAYVSSPPATISIDGAFGDWAGRTTVDADSFSVGNENIDINSVGAVNTTDSSSFYVSVFGDMLGGSYVPIIVSKPSGGGGGIIIPAKKTGQDILRVYIDSDMSSGTGVVKTAGAKVIGADYMIELKGLDGEIKSSSLYEEVSGQWSLLSGTAVLAENDQQQIELRVLSSSIAGSSAIDYVVETTDWRTRSDSATSVPLPSRALATIMAGPPGSEGWIIDGATTSMTATSMSYQRKLLFDGSSFWSFYWNGVDTVVRYSSDMGLTWSASSRVFVNPGVDEVSIWHDSANNIVYAVGDRSTSSRNIYVQRGALDPILRSITWSAFDRTLAASTLALGGKNTFISKDVSGYIWILSSNLTQTTPSRYDLSVFRSGAIDSITSWIYRGSVLDAAENQPTIKGTLVPAGSGSDMWSVYAYAGNVAARKYTGTWGAQTMVYAIGTGNPGNTESAPPSALVDGNGVLHMVYGNGHESAGVSLPYIYYVYNSKGTWSVPYRLDNAKNNQGNFYPTVSLDSSNGRVYAFWVEADSGAVGRTVMGKRNVSGAWSWLTLNPQTADPKQYLTSIYSAPGEGYICWQWTQNTTAPIQVVFDKIPEFQDVLIPVLFALVICVAAMRRLAPRRE